MRIIVDLFFEHIGVIHILSFLLCFFYYRIRYGMSTLPNIIEGIAGSSAATITISGVALLCCALDPVYLEKITDIRLHMGCAAAVVISVSLHIISNTILKKGKTSLMKSDKEMKPDSTKALDAAKLDSGLLDSIPNSEEISDPIVEEVGVEQNEQP